MTGELEAMFRQTLKSVVKEVLDEALRERRIYEESSKQEESEREDSYLLRARETAKRLAISERHLHALTVQGDIPFVRVGRLVHYSIESVERWIRETESTEPSSKGAKKELRKSKAKTSKTSKPKGSKTKSSQSVKMREAKKSSKKCSKLETPSMQKQRSTFQKSIPVESERISPFSQLLAELGVDPDTFSDISNGEIREVAKVDIPTLHGWQFLGRELPEEAMQRLRDHFGACSNVDK